MQARALGRRFGETACLFHRRGSPRVPVSLTAGSSGCLASLPGAGEPRRGVWGSSLRLPYLPPPAPPAQGEQGMEVLAAVCLSEGDGGEGVRGAALERGTASAPPWPPSPGRHAPRWGRGTPGCRPGRFGQTSSAAANKAGERPLHVCAAAAGPALCRESRPSPPRGRSAPLLPGLPGQEKGSPPCRGPGAAPLGGDAAAAGLPVGRPC